METVTVELSKDDINKIILCIQTEKLRLRNLPSIPNIKNPNTEYQADELNRIISILNPNYFNQYSSDGGYPRK